MYIIINTYIHICYNMGMENQITEAQKDFIEMFNAQQYYSELALDHAIRDIGFQQNHFVLKMVTTRLYWNALANCVDV